MTRRIVMYSLVAVAAALLLTGVGWKSLFPPKSYWSQEQAQTLSDAFNAVHRAEDIAHGPGDPGGEAFLAARRRYESLKSELDQVREQRDRTGTYVALGGVALLVASYFLSRFWKAPPDENSA